MGLVLKYSCRVICFFISVSAISATGAIQIHVARNAALAPYIGCKEYCTPNRKIKPRQARSRKLILCTTALLWAPHGLMWWDGRSWDRTWDWPMQAVLDASLGGRSGSDASCTTSCPATAAVYCPGRCGRRSCAPSAALIRWCTNGDTSATGRIQSLIFTIHKSDCKLYSSLINDLLASFPVHAFSI